MTEPRPEYDCDGPEGRLDFRIEGRIMPYVRMTQRSKHEDPRAKEYLASQQAVAWQARQQMGGREPLPAQTPLALTVTFLSADHRRDLSNLLKAVEDALQGVAYPDDRWIDAASAVREKSPQELTLVTVEVI